MGPGDLNKAICDLPQMTDPNLVRGLASPDDAGVYRISDELAIIQTVDFFTPIYSDISSGVNSLVMLYLLQITFYFFKCYIHHYYFHSRFSKEKNKSVFFIDPSLSSNKTSWYQLI